MRKKSLALFSIAAVLVMAACSSAQTQTTVAETTAAESSETAVNAGEHSVEGETSVSSGNETAVTSSAGSEAGETAAAESTGRNLIVYFSRWGNTDYPEDVDATTSASIVADQDTFGTTEYVARMIQERVGGDLHLIRTQETYPADFDTLRDQNHEEMDEGYLPALVESDLDLSQYDTVFIGYPIWATDAPQAVLSFLNEYDMSGKTVVPFCTHDGYGAGSSYSTIGEACRGANVAEGLAIESSEVPNAQDIVAEWLRYTLK